MDLLSQVEWSIRQHAMISPGEVVLAGVSGGPDSLALLHLLNQLKKKLSFQLYACHLDHMFRGEESQGDALFVERIADQWQIPLINEQVDVPKYIEEKKLSPQLGAREVRYHFYRDSAARVGATRVALGHHADDQAETVLLNLIRGTGLKGLSGIPPVRDSFYIRPLLGVRKSELEQYCRIHDISYRVDSSNLKKVYLRNRIRLELIPLLEENYNPAIIPSLNRLSDIVRDENEYLDGIARDALNKATKHKGPQKIILCNELLNGQPTALKRRMLMLAIRDLVGYAPPPTYEHIQKIMEAASEQLFHGKIELPGKIAVVKGYNRLEIILPIDASPKPFYRYPLKIPGRTVIPEINRSIQAGIMEVSLAGNPRQVTGNQVLLDLDTLQAPLYVRRRMEGDMFFPLGMRGRVKLKKFFIDLKVPRESRDAIPIVTCGDDIVWVAGFRPGEPWRISSKTRTCLRLELLEGAEPPE